jgi:uridine kinase
LSRGSRNPSRSAAVSRVAAVVASLGRPGQAAPIVLIDGPSGAGKSTLADELVGSWPLADTPELVRLDDIYPGWDGLDAASEQVVVDLLDPLRRGEPAGWWRHDWLADRRAEWHEVTQGTPLIIEGCGSLSAASARLADLAVWLDADDVIRKRRALERDAGAFDAHWDEWQAQFERFVAREAPRARAALVLDGTA